MIIQLESPASACTLSVDLLLGSQIDLRKINFSVFHSFYLPVFSSSFFNPAFVSGFLPSDHCGAGRDRQPGPEHILQYLLGKVLTHAGN